MFAHLHLLLRRCAPVALAALLLYAMWPSQQIQATGVYYTAPLAHSGLQDAFGRQRVAQPYTLFESKQLHDNSPLLWDDAETSGGGTGSSHSADLAATTMTVGATTAGTRVRQTFRRFNYQSGKSHFILLTGVLGAGADGITRRIGYFNGTDGVYFQLDDSTLSVCIRSNTSGSPVDTCTAQSAWNLDTLDGDRDGANPSGYDLDVSKTQIFMIDFEWLGVGTVRWGFVLDGKYIYTHQNINANMATTVYMSTPNLPLRYEISNDGTGAAASLVHICAAVMSEGGVEPTGVTRTISTSGTHVDANAADSLYAIVGLRLQAAHIGDEVTPIGVSVIAETGDDYEWIMCLNPTVAGTFTYGNVTNSAVQSATGATANTVTNCTQVAGGFAKASSVVTAGLNSVVKLGSAIDGTVDELVLAVRPLSSNADIQGSITYAEVL